MAPPNYTIPNTRQPIVMANGICDTTWYRFFIAWLNGTGKGVPFGTAATKSASNPADANVASVTLPVTSGHIAAFADGSGTVTEGGVLGTAAHAAIGTGGGNVPLLNGVNTWSGTQTFSSGALNAQNIVSGGGADTLTLPTSTDTLIGRATADTLTNKTIGAANLVLSAITAALSGDVLLNNVGNFFDGPSIAQGTAGTWFVSGTVTLLDTSANAAFNCKLWDGTTVIASGKTANVAANEFVTLTLSGFITSPVANVKISCQDISSTNGKIVFNASGLSMDSMISAFRVK